MKSSMLFLLAITMLCSSCATRSSDQAPTDLRDADPMIAQLSTTARKAFDAGEIAAAVGLYRRALDRSRAVDNSREISGNAYNLAACLMQLGGLGEAANLLVEAEREAIRSGDPSYPILLLAAQVARATNNTAGALAILDRLEQASIKDAVKGQALVIRSHLACDQGQPADAAVVLDRARSYAEKSEDAGLSGAIANAEGRIAILNQDWAQAAKAYDAEAAIMQKALRAGAMAEALENAGENYATSGNPQLAADRFYRSARSLMAQGNYLDALRVIERAAPLMPADGSADETMKVIANLFEEIRRSVEQQSQAGLQKP